MTETTQPLTADELRQWRADVEYISPGRARRIIRLLDALEAAQRGIGHLCDRYGLPHDVDVLIHHLEGNGEFVRAMDAKTIAIQKHKLERAQAVVEAARVRHAIGLALNAVQKDPSHDARRQQVKLMLAHLDASVAEDEALAAYDAHDAPAEEGK